MKRPDSILQKYYMSKLPKYQQRPGTVLQQRYGVGPMMGDLAQQSGVPSQSEIARQAQIRKDAEAFKKKQEAIASYRAMPKVGPAKQLSYSEQIEADERRRLLNQAYAAQNPEVTVNASGDIVPSGYGRFIQTYGPNIEKFARSWETPLAVEGAISLAPLVGSTVLSGIRSASNILNPIPVNIPKPDVSKLASVISEGVLPIRGAIPRYDEATEMFQKLLEKYPALGKTENFPFYFHGTSSANLPSILQSRGLRPFGQLSKEGRVPLKGELASGISKGGVNQQSVSTVFADDINKALDYSLGMAGKGKVDPVKKLDEWFVRGDRDEYIRLGGDNTPIFPKSEEFDDLFNRQLTEFQKLSPAEQAIVKENYPILFGMHPKVGASERFMFPRGIEGEIGLKGGASFDEIPSVFVPKSKVRSLQKTLGNQTKVFPLEDMLADPELLKRFNEMGYGSTGFSRFMDLFKKKQGGRLSKYTLPKYQGDTGSGQILRQRYGVGPTMGDLAQQSGIIDINRQAEIQRMKSAIEAEIQKRKAKEAARRYIKNQSQVGPLDMSREAVRLREEAGANYRRQQAVQNSALAQSFGALTPGGYNPGVGQIGAETFVNMNPITGPGMSALRLTQQALGQNPYGFGESAAGNVLGGIGAVGDVAGVGMIKMLPGSTGISSGIKSLRKNLFPSRVRYGVDPEYGFYTQQGNKISYDLGDVFKPKWITPSGNKFNPDYLKTLNRRDLTEYLSRFSEKDRAAIEKIISSSSNIPKPSLLRNTSPEQLREIQALAAEGRIYGYNQGMSPKPVSDWFRNSSWDEFAKEMRGTLSRFGIDPTDQRAVEEFRKTMIKGLNQAYWNDMKPVSGTGEWLNTFNRMNKEGGLLKYQQRPGTVLKQRYSVGPTMGDLAQQSGLENVASQAEIQKTGLELEKQWIYNRLRNNPALRLYSDAELKRLSKDPSKWTKEVKDAHNYQYATEQLITKHPDYNPNLSLAEQRNLINDNSLRTRVLRGRNILLSSGTPAGNIVNTILAAPGSSFANLAFDPYNQYVKPGIAQGIGNLGLDLFNVFPQLPMKGAELISRSNYLRGAKNLSSKKPSVAPPEPKKKFGLSVDELDTKGILNRSKNVRTDVDLAIGKFDQKNLIEYENGLQLHTYSKPGSDIDDVILVFNPEKNEYIAYMRRYKMGKKTLEPTNEWHIKADMPTSDKKLVKFANEEIEKIVPVKPLKYEDKTISTDGLRNWKQQQKHGYSETNDLTTPYISAAGKDDIFKGLKYSNNNDAFEYVKFSTKEDALEGASRLENFIKNQGLNYKIKVNQNNSLQIDLPKLQRAFAKGGPIVNYSGYMNGRPPKGFNWRIPGNKITMDLPGMPNRILAVPNIGLSRFVYRGEDAEFPGADYVDEYEMRDGGLPKFQERPGTYRPLNELSDAEKRQLAQRIIKNARAKLLKNQYVDVPESLKRTEDAKRHGAYSCIGGVCTILKEENIVPNVIWSNTDFAKLAPQLGFPNRGWGLKGLENLEPGDIIQYLDRDGDATNAYPHHAQIFLGINPKTGLYEFFDNFEGRRRLDLPWDNERTPNLGLRTYHKKILLDLLDPKKKRDEDQQAVIYKINPYSVENDPYIKESVLKRYQDYDAIQKEKQKSVPYTYSLNPEGPLAQTGNKDLKGVQEFLNFANDEKNINYLVDKLYELKRPGLADKEKIHRSLLNVFGILGQENKWEDRTFGGDAFGLENLYEKTFSPKGGSIGPGQIKFATLGEDFKKAFDIKKPKDLRDWKKLIPLMTAIDLTNQQEMLSWGKSFSERIIGEPGLAADEMKWDVATMSPYFYQGRGYKNIKEGLNKEFDYTMRGDLRKLWNWKNPTKILGAAADRLNTNIEYGSFGDDLSYDDFKYKIRTADQYNKAKADNYRENIRSRQKVFDPGSYGRNVWENWANNILRTRGSGYNPEVAAPTREVIVFPGSGDERTDAMIKYYEQLYGPLNKLQNRKRGGLTKYQQRPGTISLRPTSADSTVLYLNALEKEKFYRNNPAYEKVPSGTFRGKSFRDKSLLEELAKQSVAQRKYYDKPENYNRSFKYVYNQTGEILPVSHIVTRDRLGRVQGSNVLYQSPDFAGYFDPTIDDYYNPSAPRILFSPQIIPQGERAYSSTDKTGNFGDLTRIPYYEPLAVKPYAMRTAKEKIEWERKYGKKPNPKSSKTKFTKTLEKITTKDKNTSIPQISPAIIKEPIRTINAPSGTSGVFGPNGHRIGEYDVDTNTFYADYEGIYGKTSDASKAAQDFIRNREQLEQYIFERTGVKPIIKPLSETKTLKKGGLTKYQERPGTVIRDNIPSLGDAFRRAEMDRFKKKYDVDIPAESSFAFMEDWMNSPMYKMMLTSSALKTPGPRRRIDYTNMINRGWGYKFPEQESEFDEINHFRRLALKRFKENPNSFLNVQLEPLVKGAYTPSRNVIELSKDLKFPERLLTGVHEVSHATDINEYDDRYIPISDVNKMKRYAEDYQKQKGFWQKLNENSEYNKYVADPTETRARLNTLRFFGKQRGVYNPFKEKLIDKNKLKSFEDEEAYQQLRLIYSDDQILDMLNSISMTPNQGLPQAKSGGQHGGPIMGDTFTPYSRDYLTNFRNEWVATYNKPIPYRIPRDDRFDEFYHQKVNTIPQYYKTIPAWVKGLGTDMEEYREGDKNIPPKSMGKLAKGYEWVENYRTGPFRDDSQIREYTRLIKSIRNTENRKPIWNRDVKFVLKNGGQHGGLDRWFAEKWVDIKTGKPCGRQEGEDRGYPACRPSKRVSSKTPKTSSELSSEERARFKSAKTSSQRIPYSHKRRK